MAITKEVVIDKTEVVGDYKSVQCREATIIKENGVEISRVFRRYVLQPSHCVANVDSDGENDGTFTHTDTDISGESTETKAVCAAVWTDDVKAAWKTFRESQVT